MASPVELLSLSNPVFKSFTFWVGVLVIKMLLMSLLTAVQRFKTKVRGWVRTVGSKFLSNFAVGNK